MDWIILIFLLVYFLLTLAANLKLLFYFEHASDSSLSVPEVVCKVVILAGLQLAWILVVALPLDVYNRNSPFASKNDADGKTQTAGLQMRLYWAIVSWFMSMYLLLAVPFAVFYYEADFDPRITKRVPWRMALIKTCVAVVVTAILIAIVYVLCRSISMKVDQDLCKQWTSQGVSETLKDFCDSVAATAANPSSPPSISSSSAGQTRKNRGQKSEKGRDSVHEGGHPLQEGSTVFSKSSKGYYWGTGGDLKNHKETSGTNNTSPGDTSKVSTWKTHVDVNVYLLAVMSFIGWITFAIFGGIGIASLPLDAFLRFRARPRPISLLTFKETRRLIGEKARKLRFIGEALAREEVLQQELTWRDFRKKRQYRSDVNRYKKCVLDLEEEYKQLVVCMRERGENPFYSYLKLLGGILALLLSIIWVIHIILNCLLPQLLNVSPIDNHIFGFLDSMLKAMADHSVALLALLLYTFLVCYLLVCVVKGCFKFGSNFFFFIGVHPMKKDETHLNSFLFNVVLVLLSCTAIVQFTARCFQGYSQQTVAAWIFDVQFFLLPFFGFIFKYNIFIYILLFTTLLSATVLFIRLCMGDIPSSVACKKIAPIGAFPSIRDQTRALTEDVSNKKTDDEDEEEWVQGGKTPKKKTKGKRKKSRSASTRGGKENDDSYAWGGGDDGGGGRRRGGKGDDDGGRVHFAVVHNNERGSEEEDESEDDEESRGDEDPDDEEEDDDEAFAPKKKVWGKRRTRQRSQQQLSSQRV